MSQFCPHRIGPRGPTCNGGKPWRSASDRRGSSEASTNYQVQLHNHSASPLAVPLPTLASAMRDISRRLPPELLTEILSHVPVPDVLRFKQVRTRPPRHVCADELTELSRYLQVNRAFYDASIASPLVQHKIDLFKVGLEYNTAAGIDLNESRKALLQYNTCLKSLSPIEKRVVDFPPPSEGYSFKTAGGVHAVVKNSVRLFSPGSALRRIPYKEWEIPLPAAHPRGYCFYPGADIIAFADSLRTYVQQPQ